MSELGIVISPAHTVEGQLDIMPPKESEIVSHEVFLQKSTKSSQNNNKHLSRTNSVQETVRINRYNLMSQKVISPTQKQKLKLETLG